MKFERKKGTTEIPTASMADIAFLLIVFFMVTTTFSVNLGFDFGLPPKEQETSEQSESRPALTVIVDRIPGDVDRNYRVVIMDENQNVAEFYNPQLAGILGQPDSDIRFLSETMDRVFEDVRAKQTEWYKLPVYILIRRNAPWEGFVDVWEEVQKVEKEQLYHFPDSVEPEKRKLATHIPHVNQVEDILEAYRQNPELWSKLGLR